VTPFPVIQTCVSCMNYRSRTERVGTCLIDGWKNQIAKCQVDDCCYFNAPSKLQWRNGSYATEWLLYRLPEYSYRYPNAVQTDERRELYRQNFGCCPPAAKFTMGDAEDAFDAWHFNCGPAAVCAVAGLTPTEVRPHLRDFEQRGFTNPTLTWAILGTLGIKGKRIEPGFCSLYAQRDQTLGLMRVQWGGPWTAEGVPVQARYRHTHWVAWCVLRRVRFVFDINCIQVGGLGPILGMAATGCATRDSRVRTQERRHLLADTHREC
jgi:hypothetical protein